MFIKPNIEKLDETDLRIKAWNISRPQLPDVDSISEIENIDLSLNELKTYYFDITSSVLFRELILSIRPISVWATTSRNIPLTDVKISEEYKSNKAISEFSILCLQSALNSDKHQDIARMELPITSSTRYVIGINHRTLVAFLKTLKIHSEFLYNIYGVMLSQQANLKNLKEYSYGDLSSSVVPSDTEVLADYGTSSFLDMSITKAPLAVSLVAQMVRHQRNTIKNSLWEIAKDPSLHSITLGDEVDIIMYVPRSSYEGMVKHRTFCTIADPVLWNNFNKVALSTIPKEDFVKNTPCKCNPSKCAFLKDSLGRVELHDPGLPCPILLESPSIIEDMKKIYGDDVMTVRVMEHLVTKKAIKDNPENELRVAYENNLKNKG